MSTDISTPSLTEAGKVLYAAIKEYAASRHVFDIGPGDMDRMLSAALSKVSALGPKTLANLSSSGAAVLDAVQSGFAQVYGTPSEAQRHAQAQLVINSTASSDAIAGRGMHGVRGVSAKALAMQDDGGRDSPSERVTSTLYKERLSTDASGAGFAKQLGIDPAYAGFFATGSPEMRNALRDALRHGNAIREDQVKGMNDVQMVVGAIRAGKMKPDDPRIPDSVKKVIADMKGKGIDPATADPKKIKKYFKDNPKALEVVRKEAKADEKTKVGGMTAAQSKEAMERVATADAKAAEKKGAVAAKAKPRASADLAS